MEKSRLVTELVHKNANFEVLDGNWARTGRRAPRPERKKAILRPKEGNSPNSGLQSHSPALTRSGHMRRGQRIEYKCPGAAGHEGSSEKLGKTVETAGTQSKQYKTGKTSFGS